AGILPDGPGLRDVHRGVGTAQIGRDAGEGVEEVQILDVVGPIDRLHRDAFRREPGSAGCGRLRHRGREIDAGEVRNTGHDAIVSVVPSAYLAIRLNCEQRRTPPPRRLRSSRRSISARHLVLDIYHAPLLASPAQPRISRTCVPTAPPPRHPTCRPSRWMRSRNLT